MKRLFFTIALSTIGVSAFAAETNTIKTTLETCAGCHGMAGISAVPVYPNLAGQKAEYVEKQLKAFRDGSRKDLIMSSMAESLSDEDISELAAFYESL